MKKFICTLALISMCLPTYADMGHYDAKLENYTFEHDKHLRENSDCPKDRPLFPKIEIMEYPHIIDAYADLRLKRELNSLKLLKMMEEYPEFKELASCLLERERCLQVDTVLKEAEKIKQENEAITTQNQKIEESTKEKNSEIKAYNNTLTEEKNKFEKYQRILDKISLDGAYKALFPIPFGEDILGRVKDIRLVEEETISTLEEKWKRYLDKIEYIKNRNTSLRNRNESVLKENIAIETENKKVEVKNQKIQVNNDLLLKVLNMYFTPEYLGRLSKDYETILEKHCISCDDPHTFSDMYEDDCNICPNREFIPDQPNEKYSRGKCQLRNKDEKNI